MAKDNSLGEERRQYIRIDSVFPVLFSILSLDEKTVIAGCLQGFTRDIGKGGICITVNNFTQELEARLKNRKVKLSLGIEMPLSAEPVKAVATVTWVRGVPECPNRYVIGLRYEKIEAKENQRLIHYARIKKIFPTAAITSIVVLSLAVALGTYVNIKMIQGNKALVGHLVTIIQDSSVAKMKIKLISKEKEDLKIKISTLESRIQSVEEEKNMSAQMRERLIEEEKTVSARKISELDAMAGELAKQKEALQEQMIALQNRENVISEDLLHLDKQRVEVEKANLDKMYQWLKVHQNPRTGLIASFEGDRDIAGWAFIYDQALVAQAYANFSDFQRAQKMLDFFAHRVKRPDGLFYNAYYAADGSPAEYVVHSGPNIWLGIAALQYTQKSGDRQYLSLAEGIAEKIMKLQAQDPEGGIRGGPEIKWYSTEHNLDAYAFFNMLYKLTAAPKYSEAAQKTLTWIQQYSYGRSDLPINRGKGDATVATDTYAWAVASIGPEKLEALGMNPDRIIEFAEQNCSVQALLRHADGKVVTLKGFDFAAQRNVARGGVISSEWTAQMVISFKIMADYYFKQGMIAKARSYLAKADECLLSLSNMIITSPSPTGQGANCLPYSNQEFVDTGHGWFTPKGKCTGSVAGTTYTLFAFYDYNPLELAD